MSTWSKAPARWNEPKPETTPGPGSYDVKVDWETYVAPSFGVGERWHELQTQTVEVQVDSQQNSANEKCSDTNDTLSDKTRKRHRRTTFDPSEHVPVTATAEQRLRLQLRKAFTELENVRKAAQTNDKHLKSQMQALENELQIHVQREASVAKREETIEETIRDKVETLFAEKSKQLTTELQEQLETADKIHTDKLHALQRESFERTTMFREDIHVQFVRNISMHETELTQQRQIHNQEIKELHAESNTMIDSIKESHRETIKEMNTQFKQELGRVANEKQMLEEKHQNFVEQLQHQHTQALHKLEEEKQSVLKTFNTYSKTIGACCLSFSQTGSQKLLALREELNGLKQQIRQQTSDVWEQSQNDIMDMQSMLHKYIETNQAYVQNQTTKYQERIQTQQREHEATQKSLLEKHETVRQELKHQLCEKHKDEMNSLRKEMKQQLVDQEQTWMTQLKKEVEQHEQKLVSVQAELIEAHRATSETKNQFQDLQNESQETIQMLQRDLESSREDFAKAKQEASLRLEKEQQKVQNGQKEQSKLRKQIKELQKSIKVHEAREDKLRQEVDSQEEANHLLKMAQKEQFDLFQEKQQNAMQTIQQKLTVAIEREQKLRSKYDSLCQTLNAHKEEINQLHQQQEDGSKELATIQNEKKELQCLNEELQMKLQQQEKQIQTHTMNIEVLQEEKKNLTNFKMDAMKQKDTLVKQVQELEEQVQTAHIQHNNYATEQQQKYTTLFTEFEQIQQNLNKLQDESRIAQEKYDKNMVEMGQLREENEKVRYAQQDLVQSKDTLTNTLEKVQKQLTDANAALENHQNESACLEIQAKKFKSLSAERSKEIASLKTELQRNENLCHKYQQENTDMLNQMQQLREKAEQADKHSKEFADLLARARQEGAMDRALEAESEAALLRATHTAALAHAQQVTQASAKLAGHHNTKQKIRYVEKLQTQNLELTQQVAKLQAKITALKKQHVPSVNNRKPLAERSCNSRVELMQNIQHNKISKPAIRSSRFSTASTAEDP